MFGKQKIKKIGEELAVRRNANKLGKLKTDVGKKSDHVGGKIKYIREIKK